MHAGTTMATGSNGSAIDDILGDRAAIEAHFGFHLSDDESDLDVPSEDSDWEDWEDCESDRESG